MNGCEKRPLQKSYELAVGVKSYTIDLVATNRQFDWPEIYLVYDKSNKHTILCNSYNLDGASTFMQNFPIENVSNTYSTADELKYDIIQVT